MNEIKNYNGLSSDNINIGDVLKIPTNNTTYTVKAGDSLWSISRKYGTSVDAIKRLNGLNSDFLVIGTTLKIPN